MIARGLIDGVIRLIMSPHEDGVVASVGEYWFYFGGQTAEECSSVEEYTAAVPFPCPAASLARFSGNTIKEHLFSFVLIIYEHPRFVKSFFFVNRFLGRP